MNRILKFGGSSLADARCIKQVSSIIRSRLQLGDELSIVVSAFKGVTDALINLSVILQTGAAHERQTLALIQHHGSAIDELGLGNDSELYSCITNLTKQFNQTLSDFPHEPTEFVKWKDELLSYGERFSACIISAYLNHVGVEAEALDARQVVITDNNFGDAYVHYQRSYDQIRIYLNGRGKLQVITGFIGAVEDGATTTLGRSGSDYTASIFGAALNVDEIQIWTDVDGILTANPNLVDQAVPIGELTYEEAMELAHAGAKVIFPPTMIPALYKKIPIVIKNTFNPDHPGSRISSRREINGEVAVGLSCVSNVSLIRMQGAGMVGVRGINARLFSCLANSGISIMLVSQAFSEHSTCFALKPDETESAVQAIESEFAHEFKLKYIDKLVIESNQSLVAVVGEGMQGTPGIAAIIFDVLGQESINVEAIAQGSSRRNISFIVRDADVGKAMQALHNELFQRKSARNGKRDFEDSLAIQNLSNSRV